MSASGNPYSPAPTGFDAWHLVQLGIPPDQAIKIATRAGAMRSRVPMPGPSTIGLSPPYGPPDQRFPDLAPGTGPAFGTPSPMATDPWAIFPNVDEDSISANQRGLAVDRPDTVREARELHPDAPNWYGEHSRWQPHWNEPDKTLDPQTGFQGYHSDEPFQWSADGGQTWQLYLPGSGGNVHGFGRDRNGDIRTYDGDRILFRPLMMSAR